MEEEERKVSVAEKIVRVGINGATKLIPKGIRHPDDLIANKELYAPRGRVISPIPGQNPGRGYSLFTMKYPRGRRGGKQVGMHEEQMANIRSLMFPKKKKNARR